MKKRTKENHTPYTQIGQGDYYGTGIKNPVGKPRDIMGQPNKKVNKTKPPKSLA